MLQSSPLKIWSTVLCAVSTSIVLACAASAAQLSDYVNLDGDKTTESANAFGFPVTDGFPSTITGGKSLTLTGAPDQRVVLKLTDLILSSGATLTLSGNAGTVFVINVTKNFWLNSAKIVLAGGLTSENVVFNFVGKGDIRLTGGSSIAGNMLTTRKVALSGKSLILGRAIATKVLLSGGSLVKPAATSL